MGEEEHKSGFLAIVGRPNVGKSTLMNRITGRKVSIITERPQTTRNRIAGVKNYKNGQLIFLDTPGIHKPTSLINRYMVKTALDTLREVDLILYMVDERANVAEDEEHVFPSLRGASTPVFLLLNKIDLMRKEKLLPLIDSYGKAMDFEEMIPISALSGENIELLLELSLKLMQEGPKYFPPDMYTDQPDDFLMSELIREKAIRLCREEVPYAIAVVVEKVDRSSDALTRVEATIYVERESQKRIVIGKGGSMLKEIGSQARKEMEWIFGEKIHLDLWVKAKKRWRDIDRYIKELGHYR
jgi:GTP-binding protein Era